MSKMSKQDKLKKIVSLFEEMARTSPDNVHIHCHGFSRNEIAGVEGISFEEEASFKWANLWRGDSYMSFYWREE